MLKRVVVDDEAFVPEVWIKDMCEKLTLLYFQNVSDTAWREEHIASAVAKDFESCIDSISVILFPPL